jgi:hypothetical protein
MSLDPFLIRLLIAVLVIYLGEKLLAVVGISEGAKQLLGLILIIACVLFVIFGNFLPNLA